MFFECIELQVTLNAADWLVGGMIGWLVGWLVGCCICWRICSLIDW